jgi:hypothetical protein
VAKNHQISKRNISIIIENKNRMEKLLKFIVSIFIIMFLLSNTFAYSEEVGVELGDKIHVKYVGEFLNGTVFDSNDGVTFTLSYEQLIEGFVDGVLGMKINENRTFEVPPEKGYSSGPLAQETLVFNVNLLSVENYVISITPENESEIIQTPALPIHGFGIFIIAFSLFVMTILIVRKK